MNTKRILLSVVAGAMLTGSVAMAAHGNDQARSKTKVRAAKATTTMTTGGSAIRLRQIATGRNTAVRTGTVRNRSTVYVGGSRYGSRYGYSYPSSSYGYGYGYPYYSYGPSISFGFGYPYSYGYYPYGYSSYYPYDYYHNQPAYGAYNGSIVVQVQTRLARAGYYHGPIDGAMGPRTHYAIRAYERDHGLRVDGMISGTLLRNMGLRY